MKNLRAVGVVEKIRYGKDVKVEDVGTQVPDEDK